MAASPDPQSEREPGPEIPAAAPAAGAAVPGARRRGWAKLADSPLLPLLSMAVVGLLVFVLTDLSGRISHLEDKIETRFAVQDAKIEARFAAQDAKIEAINLKLTALIDEINLKLTALIAGLGMDDAVNSALEGRVRPLVLRGRANG